MACNMQSPSLECLHCTNPGITIMIRNAINRMGNMRWGCAAMLLGLPLPIVILAFLFGGCNPPR